MARFIIVAMLSATPVTFPYNHADKALAKARSLTRKVVTFTITDVDADTTITVEDLERLFGRS